MLQKLYDCLEVFHSDPMLPMSFVGHIPYDKCIALRQPIILLICWWKKSCTSWLVVYPVIYKVFYIPGGAGFLPSTVAMKILLIFSIRTTHFYKWWMFRCNLLDCRKGILLENQVHRFQPFQRQVLWSPNAATTFSNATERPCIVFVGGWQKQKWSGACFPGGGFKYLFLTPTWGYWSIWQIYFKGVETTT